MGKAWQLKGQRFNKQVEDGSWCGGQARFRRGVEKQTPVDRDEDITLRGRAKTRCRECQEGEQSRQGDRQEHRPRHRDTETIKQRGTQRAGEGMIYSQLVSACFYLCNICAMRARMSARACVCVMPSTGGWTRICFLSESVSIGKCL